MRFEKTLQVAEMARRAYPLTPEMQRDAQEIRTMMQSSCNGHITLDEFTEKFNEAMKTEITPIVQQIAEAVTAFVKPLRNFVENLAVQWNTPIQQPVLSPKWQRKAYRLQMLQYPKRQRKAMKGRRGR